MMRAKSIDGFLITSLKNIRYLTGFTGSSGFLILTMAESLFVTDSRYQEQASKEVTATGIMLERGNRIALIRQTVKKKKIQRLGFESSVSFAVYERLQSCNAELVPMRDAIERLRAVKDAEEIAAISEAVRRAEAAFLSIRKWIRPGITEIELARRLESALKEQNCRHAAFEIIVASGANASMPHAQPSQKKIAPGDCVLIDWGGEAGGYYSDLTRTILVPGSGNQILKEIYTIVNRARSEAIDAVKIGVKTQLVDSVARKIIKDAGYGDYFGHSLGHGIGLDVHEYPYLSWAKGERIRNGMVFSIEPGIYIPGVGGVRIEDLVVVSGNAASVLTNLSREAE